MTSIVVEPAESGAEPDSFRAEEESGGEIVVMSGVQLLLAEKRTSLSVTRTGIAVLALPLGVLSLLVATSRYYRVEEASALFIALVSLCVGLVFLGAYLVAHSLRRIRHIDEMVRNLRRGHPLIEPFID